MSPQSLSVSQRQWGGIHRPLSQWNDALEHVAGVIGADGDHVPENIYEVIRANLLKSGITGTLI